MEKDILKINSNDATSHNKLLELCKVSTEALENFQPVSFTSKYTFKNITHNNKNFSGK